METFIADTGTKNVPESAWGLWILLVGVTVAACGVAVVRVVPKNQRLVVFRSGHLHRVAGPGLTTRVPLLDQVRTVSLDPVQIPVMARATSRDRVSLVAWGTAELRVVEASLVHHAEGDPIDAAVTMLEAAIATELARASIADLDEVQGFLETLLSARLSAGTAAWGVEVIAIRVSEIDARLAGHFGQDRQQNDSSP